MNELKNKYFKKRIMTPIEFGVKGRILRLTQFKSKLEQQGVEFIKHIDFLQFNHLKFNKFHKKYYLDIFLLKKNK